MQEIDWHEEWQKHAFQFSEGFAHIDFKKLGIKKEKCWRAASIKLAPGPGFGDCSHPTTRLCLKMMANNLANQEVLDLGSGSGILSLAAIAFGAKHVVGIEIDPTAIPHSQENARLNGYEKLCKFAKTTKIVPDVIVMNMIRTEQQEAFDSLPKPYRKAKIALTSGILKEDQKTYLKQTQAWGWTLHNILEEEGWLGFHFILARSAP